jgi:predicted lipoprotein with Yx(FWY)xxD motif
MTAHVFDKDVAGSGTSASTGDCLKTWAPITTSSGQPRRRWCHRSGGCNPAANGASQITIGGLPLYTFANDKAPADTNGQLVKGVWHVITPSGEQNGKYCSRSL